MNKLLKSLKESENVTETTNGQHAYKSTLNAVLDFYSKGGAFRNVDESVILNTFADSAEEDLELTMRTLFYLRDARGGQGERRVFRTILPFLAESKASESLRKNLHLVPIYGRWDDLWVLLNTSLKNDVVTLVQKQLDKDVENETVSLLGKWMPSENASSKETKKNATILRKALKMNPKQYRTTLSSLRKKISIVETSMSSKKWSEINYSQVPSRASILYRKAFARNDESRYYDWQNKVSRGEEKINASVTYPYEIFEQYCKNGYKALEKDQTLENAWKALPNYVDPKMNVLVVADVSGSMSCANGRPMAMSVSLASYFAERNTEGPFKDSFMTFSDKPNLCKISKVSVRDTFNGILSSDWGYSTNLEATFNLVLKTAIKNEVKRKDMPDAIVVISDMQFDRFSENTSTMRAISSKFKEAGYDMPNLVWWNVNAGENGLPVTVNDFGTACVSGGSPTIFKAFANFLETGKILTPMDMMLETLNSERYSDITV